MDLIKITPNKERAKNIMKMILLLEERINKENKNKMSALIVADYYEIIKELLTAILTLDGYKTLSHKDLVDYLEKKYPQFTSYDISILNELRILRNRIAYEGFFVDVLYLNRNESSFKSIIKKLKEIIDKKLK